MRKKVENNYSKVNHPRENHDNNVTVQNNNNNNKTMVSN